MTTYCCPKCLTTLHASEGEANPRTECPHCGARVKVPGRNAGERRGFPIWSLAVIIPAGAMLVTCCVGGVGLLVYLGTSSAGAPPFKSPTVTSIRETDLFEAYQDNVAAADLKYTGKPVEVWTIRAPLWDYSPKKDSDSSYYLDLNCGTGWVRMVFKTSETAKLAEFKPRSNSRIVLRGVCRGLGPGSNVVRITDAEVVSVTENPKGGNGAGRP